MASKRAILESKRAILLVLAIGASVAWAIEGGTLEYDRGTPGVPVGVEAPVSVLDLDFDWLESAACLLCHDCITEWGWWGHLLAGTPAHWLDGRAGYQHMCWEGPCFVHSYCQPGDRLGSTSLSREREMLEITANALKRATPDELLALLSKYPERVHIHNARRALQLTGCENAVIASYGITSIPALGELLD